MMYFENCVQMNYADGGRNTDETEVYVDLDCIEAIRKVSVDRLTLCMKSGTSFVMDYINKKARDAAVADIRIRRCGS